MTWSRGPWLKKLAAVVCLLVGLSGTPSMASTLPDCSRVHDGVIKPVEKAVRAAIVKYYVAKKLTPISIYKNEEQVRTVKLWTVGVHPCRNPGGPNGAYVGAVPKTALAAVQVYVYHKPYPVVESASSFVMVAKMRTTGWKVVSEGTGP